MEGFLVSGLDLLRPGGSTDAAPAAPASAADSSRLQRAIDHIHAHAHEGLTLAALAAAACMSPRALEAAFRRHHDTTPLAYARGVRLDRVREALEQAAQGGEAVSVTDVALQYGFIHMGRFAAYYRQRFGCSPSASLRGA
jgi:transcriptional regulator GlxA family with amidase domain